MGGRHALSDDDREVQALRERVCASPELWWQVLQRLIADAPNDEYRSRAARGPLRAVLDCDGDRLLNQAVPLARSSPKMASALTAAMNGHRQADLYQLLGGGFVVETLLRYHTEKADFDFWAWETLNDLVRDDPAEAWTVIVELVNRSPNKHVLGMVSAGPLEDFIGRHAAGYVSQIEGESRRNPRFKQALAGVWVMSLPPELFDRIEAAAGVRLRRI